MAYIINLLVQYKASINYKTKRGYTALHDLLFKDYNRENERHYIVKILEYLIHEKLDINAQCYTHGTTPLHIACLRRNFQAVQLLLENGADVNKRDKENRTALCYCKPKKGCWKWHPRYTSSKSSSFDIIELLLQKGVCIIGTMKTSYDKIACLCLLKENEYTINILKNLFIPLQPELAKEEIDVLINLAKRNNNSQTIEFLTQQKSILNAPPALPKHNSETHFKNLLLELDLLLENLNGEEYISTDTPAQIKSKNKSPQKDNQKKIYALYLCIPLIGGTLLFLAKNLLDGTLTMQDLFSAKLFTY